MPDQNRPTDEQVREWGERLAVMPPRTPTAWSLARTLYAELVDERERVANLAHGRDIEQTALRGAIARIAELEAAQSRCQTTTAIAVWDGVADGRSIWCELPDGHDGKHRATVPQPGNVDATVDWGNPPTERIGYAVGYCLDSEFVSLGSDTLYTAPAEAADELAAAQSESPATPFRVYELREVRGEGAPSAAPAGYAVVTRNPEGGLHRSATVWDDLDRATAAGDFQARHAEGTGCSAAVYALREVQP
jgi:hypothetical protein